MLALAALTIETCDQYGRREAIVVDAPPLLPPIDDLPLWYLYEYEVVVGTLPPLLPPIMVVVGLAL